MKKKYYSIKRTGKALKCVWNFGDKYIIEDEVTYILNIETTFFGYLRALWRLKFPKKKPVYEWFWID